MTVKREFINYNERANRYTVYADGRVKRTAPKLTVSAKEYQRAYQRRLREKRPHWHLWKVARLAAKRGNIPFTLAVKDITIPVYCKYLGYKLTNVVGEGYVPTNMSLDRIDPAKGYERGNIQVISAQASRAKANMTIDQLVIFALNVLDVHAEDAKRLE